MQAGLGGASTTAHRAAELSFVLGELQAAGALQAATPSLHSCAHPASTVLLLAQLPRACRGVGQGSRELWVLNSFFGAIWYQDLLLPHCTVPAAALSPVQGPSLAMDTTGSQEGKSLGVTFSTEPRFLQPCCHQLPAEAELEQLDAPFVSWGRIGSCYTKGGRGNGARQRRLSQGTTTTATAEKARQAGLWESYTFPHQERMVGDV